MPAPFAALEARINAATIAHLANVAASVGAVSGVEGTFDNAYEDAFGIVAGTSPSLLILTAAAPAVAHGTAVVIGGVSYTVTNVRPDGTGMTRLMLQEV